MALSATKEAAQFNPTPEVEMMTTWRTLARARRGITRLLTGSTLAFAVMAAGLSAQQTRTGYIGVPGARLYYSIVGSGPTLMVLHGGPGLSQDYLRPQLDSLLGGAIRLIYYDQRASGRSTGEADSTRLTMQQFVEDLDAVRDSLGIDRLNLLGHSFGGLLAMEYAIAHPTHVAKLILLATDPASWVQRTPYQLRMIRSRTTPADSAEEAAITSKPGWYRDPVAFGTYLRLVLRTYFYDPSKVDRLSLRFDSVSLARLELTERRVRADLGHYDIRDQLHRITAHTLIIQGDAGIFSVAGAETIRDSIPDARLVVLHNVGHFAYIEAPARFAREVITFLH